MEHHRRVRVDAMSDVRLACCLLGAALASMTACGIPGDPETLVVNGEPFAGYAWSGPGDLCCHFDGTVYVGWQIWFTNTDYCPTSPAQALAVLTIISPERTERPSTALPSIDNPIVPIRSVFLDPTSIEPITEPMASLGASRVSSTLGTLTLTLFSMEEIRGSFEVTSSTIDGDGEMHGEFRAKRCGRIH
jgi:hypothetical protein